MMSCHGNFKKDRTCELCHIVNSYEYNQCKLQHEESIEFKKKLNEIEEKCPHRKESYEEYERFYGCYKDVDRYRDQPSCKVCLECEQYIK
jgi:hypothetical protein